MTYVIDNDGATTSSNHIAGRYRIVEPIACHGMSAVWLAQDERLKRKVAVKLLPSRPQHPFMNTVDLRSRLHREARLAAQVRHPNVVTVFDLVEHNRQPCLVLEYLPSRSLSNLVAERGRLEPAFVARIGAQIAGALSATHDLGIVHCDVNPTNILISDTDTAKISDFGLARSSDEPEMASADIGIGTPAYLPPETARGESPTSAADVFSLGATLFAAVAGHSPYAPVNDALSHVRASAAGAMPAPTHAARLAPLLQRALAADPADRPTMNDLRRELHEAFQDDVQPLHSEPDTAPSLRSPRSVGRHHRAGISPHPRRSALAVGGVAASALALTALAVTTQNVLWDTKEFTAASPATAVPPAEGTQAVEPLSPPAPAIPESPTPHPAPVPGVEQRAAEVGSTPEISDVPIEWSDAGQLVIDYYAGAQRADGWTLLDPDARRGFVTSEGYREYWSQFSQVWAHSAHGVTVNDDGSVNVPVDVTYISDGRRIDESKIVQVNRRDGRLLIVTEAK